jgi:parvulin-like peptidyl-prolyl isomerase
MLIPAWLNKPNTQKVLFGFCILVSATSCDFISSRLLTKPVVQIEDHRFSAKDFSKELAAKLKNLDALSAKDPKILSVLKEQLVNDFIVKTLIDLWLKDKGVFVTKEELDKELKSLSASYPTDAAFQESLAETGMSFSEWANKVESALKQKKLAQILSSNAAPISNEELLSYYDSHKTQYVQNEAVLLAHISIEDENQADIIHKLLKQQTFEAVAKKYSSEYTEESKDLYGWVEKEYANGLDKVFKMRIGELLGPVKMGERLQIFKVVEKRSAKQKSFAEVSKEVLSEVTTLRETARFTSWLDEQFKKYKIKKNLSMLDSIRVETQ